jgi:hypothetical protein
MERNHEYILVNNRWWFHSISTERPDMHLCNKLIAVKCITSSLFLYPNRNARCAWPSLSFQAAIYQHHSNLSYQAKGPAGNMQRNRTHLANSLIRMVILELTRIDSWNCDSVSIGIIICKQAAVVSNPPPVSDSPFSSVWFDFVLDAFPVVAH